MRLATAEGTVSYQALNNRHVGLLLRASALLLLLEFFLVGSPCAWAQVDPALEQGVKPYGGYYTSDFDSISMSTGALDIKVPLLSYPQTGGKLTLNFQLEYETSGWSVSVLGTNPPLQVRMTDNLFRTPSILEDHHMAVYTGCGGSYPGLLGWPGIIAPDGSIHELGETSETLGTTWNFESSDATGLKLAGFQFYNPPRDAHDCPYAWNYYGSRRNSGDYDRTVQRQQPPRSFVPKLHEKRCQRKHHHL